MSISSSLASAMSGLTAAARTAEQVSSNISNALTDGYGRRSLALSPARTGGVGIDGVIRHQDPGLLADRRLADAERDGAAARTDYHTRIEGLIGTPGDGASLTTSLADFEAALVDAAGHPGSEARLNGVLRAAQSLSAHLGRASQGVQQTRRDADAGIAADVGALDDGLSQIARLNRDITVLQARGTPTASLVDRRQALIDNVAAIVPVREVPRANGAIALYTLGGAVLLDGKAAEIGFRETPTITAHQTLGGGHLSGLTFQGRALDPGPGGPFGGGRLEAAFAIRDDLAVASQKDLDAVAQDLVERFQSVPLDPSLAAGDPGLFTDAGAALSPADAIGLASRMTVNAAADPALGGAVWRLRDGLGAAAPGPAGASGLLAAMGAALTEPRPATLPRLSGSTLSARDLAQSVVSRAGLDRARAEQSLSHAASRHTQLRHAELVQGVDTDAEMQRLLLVEQTYAANARMIEVADEMMQTLLRI